MKKANTLSEKLKSYSLLAGSMFASSVAAGQIIYTDVNPDVELGGAVPLSFTYDSAYALDLNNDGTVDFRIRLDIYSALNPGYAFREKIRWENNSFNWVVPYTIGYKPFLRKFNCGD